MRNNKKGFTLVELLVVIAIIGLLSTLAVVALNNARQKSRDARRVADIKQVQTALEMYYNDVSDYPAAPADTICSAPAVAGDTKGCCLSEDGGISAACSGTVYMNIIPGDPDNTANYNYSYDAASTYSITYTLEGTTGGIGAGAHTATSAGIANP